jgi:hypothetical protein
VAGDWGGRADQYCRECRCRKQYIHMRDREIWIFDWCYHDVQTEENVRLLESLFYMLNEHKVAAA